jgi:hypothetical protein
MDPSTTGPQTDWGLILRSPYLIALYVIFLIGAGLIISYACYRLRCFRDLCRRRAEPLKVISDPPSD